MKKVLSFLLAFCLMSGAILTCSAATTLKVSEEPLVNITNLGVFGAYIEGDLRNAFDGNPNTYMDVDAAVPDDENYGNVMSLRFNRGYDIRKVVVKTNYTQDVLASCYFHPAVGNYFRPHGTFKNAIFTSSSYYPYNMNMVFNAEKSDNTFSDDVTLVYEVPADNQGNFQAFGLHFADKINLADFVDNVPENYKDGDTITVTPKIYEIEVYATTKSVNLVNVGVKAKSVDCYKNGGTYTGLHKPRDPIYGDWVDLTFYNNDGWGCIDLMEPTEIDFIQLTPLNTSEYDTPNANNDALLHGMNIAVCNQLGSGFAPAGSDAETLLSYSSEADDKRRGANPWYLEPTEGKKFRYICYKYPCASTTNLRWLGLQIYADPAKIGEYDGYRDLTPWAINVDQSSAGYRMMEFLDLAGVDGKIDNGSLDDSMKRRVRAQKVAFVETKLAGDAVGKEATIELVLNNKRVKIPFTVTGENQRINIPAEYQNAFVHQVYVYKPKVEESYVGSLYDLKAYTPVYYGSLTDVASESDAPSSLYNNLITFSGGNSENEYSSSLTITLNEAQYISHLDLVGATNDITVTAKKADGTTDTLEVYCPADDQYNGTYGQALVDCGMKKYKSFTLSSADGTFGLAEARILAYTDMNTYCVESELSDDMPMGAEATATYLSALDDADEQEVQLVVAGYSNDGLADIAFGSVTSRDSAWKTITATLESDCEDYKAFTWNTKMKPLTLSK